MDCEGRLGVGEVHLYHLFMQRKLIVCWNKVGGELKNERVYSPGTVHHFHFSVESRWQENTTDWIERH
jgi:hypothetical protein